MPDQNKSPTKVQFIDCWDGNRYIPDNKGLYQELVADTIWPTAEQANSLAAAMTDHKLVGFAVVWAFETPKGIAIDYVAEENTPDGAVQAMGAALMGLWDEMPTPKGGAA